MKGEFIGVVEDVSVFEAEKEFYVKSCNRAVLHITALGLYFAKINGQRVGDAYLTPGWTSYNKMLQVQEYDVSSLVRLGKNTLTVTVGEGWYKGELAWGTQKNCYGSDSAVCAELCVDDQTICTDTQWVMRESHIRFSGIYDGETWDFLSPKHVLTAKAVAFNKAALVAQMCEPVRNIERIAVQKTIRTPKGELVFDFGQNIAGVVEIKVPEDLVGTITLKFAEVLIDGNFNTENLRKAKATDVFTVKGGETLCPEFTYHGFRYVQLIGAQLSQERVTAIVRHTDMKRTGYLETSDEKLNRLLANIVWGQRGNFVDIPTDCPQRDERLGWTGDINVFGTTAAYNYDVRLFLKKWLADLRNDQAVTGEVPHVVPDVLFEKDIDTSAVWGDVVTMLPWKLYMQYGDIEFISENYKAMKRFVSSREKNCKNGFVVRGREFGDWLALDNEPYADSDYNNYVGRTDIHYISNIFNMESLRIIADSARLLGKRDEEAVYRKRQADLLKQIRAAYFTATGRLAYDTVTAQVLALHFNIVKEKHRKELASQLNENVIRHRYRVTTGFIGTPYLLFALFDNGYKDTAEKVLMNRDCPGWLYAVDMGATTVWERWNSLLPNGQLNPDGMNSFNHYAYGSVMEFIYRRIAGIEPTKPGFTQVNICPYPLQELPVLHARYKSVRGDITVGYKRSGNKIVYRAEIPKSMKANIILPNEGVVAKGNGDFEFTREWEVMQ